MSQPGGPQWPDSEIKRYEIAHRQIQATVDRLGAENERLRAALEEISDTGSGDACNEIARNALNQLSLPLD